MFRHRISCRICVNTSRLTWNRSFRLSSKGLNAISSSGSTSDTISFVKPRSWWCVLPTWWWWDCGGFRIQNSSSVNKPIRPWDDEVSSIFPKLEDVWIVSCERKVYVYVDEMYFLSSKFLSTIYRSYVCCPNSLRVVFESKRFPNSPLSFRTKQLALLVRTQIHQISYVISVYSFLILDSQRYVSFSKIKYPFSSL